MDAVDRHLDSNPDLRRVNVLGVGVSPVNLEQALGIVQGWIIRREPHYVCVTPAHAIMECDHDPELLPIYNASGLTVPDGMSLVWLLRLKGYRQVGRVYGPDLMLALCERSLDLGYRHFFYGGAPGVVEDLVGRLGERFPGLHVAGTHTPPFRPLTSEEDREVVERIAASGADIVWVGISTPKQERWMAEHVDRLGAPVLIGVGAAFDFLSGHKVQAPRWVQRSGLEWLFRLASEPRRLWPRYRQYPKFLLLVLAQSLGLKVGGRGGSGERS
jgi:N-acetylglucosaminyldiphosphoundecaprenol N-acetyl-beta-D-mannosaminyltransferase